MFVIGRICAKGFRNTSPSLHSANRPTSLISVGPNRLHQWPWKRRNSPCRFHSVYRFFGYSFLLHLLWENAQAPLYEGFTDEPGQLWDFDAIATGDMAFPLVFSSFWPWSTGTSGGQFIELPTTGDTCTTTFHGRPTRGRLCALGHLRRSSLEV